MLYYDCIEAQKKIEEWQEKNIVQAIEKPIYTWVQNKREECKKKKWWNPATWICWLVTFLVQIVTWIVVTIIIKTLILVIKYIVVVICYLIHIIIRAWTALCYGLYIVTHLRRRPFDSSANPIEKPGWRLMFHDEFNAHPGSLPDHSKWRTSHYNGYRYDITAIECDNPHSPLEYRKDENFKFTGSSIKLIEKKESVDFTHHTYEPGQPGDNTKWTAEYTNATLESVDSFKIQYGYFEARIKTPSAYFWPAFWLIATESWPPEIDISEFYTMNNFRYSCGTFYAPGPDGNLGDGKKIETLTDMSKKFNVYACEWNDKEIIWYFNNIKVFKSKKGMEYFKYPMFVILSISLDTSKYIDYTKAILPNCLEVDYVRVYKKV